LVTPVDDTVNRFLLIGSYFGALYLWVFVFIYIPNIVIFSFAFLFTGLFIASASKTGIVNTYTLNFIKNPRLNFPFILAFVVLVIVSATAGYFVMQRYVASAFVGRGLQQLATTGAIDAGEANIKKGIVLNGSSDRFLRTLSDVRIAKLNTLLQNSDLSEEKAWGEFQRVLFDAIQSAESAVRLDPNNYANWVVLGRVYEVIVPLQIDTTAYENAREAYEQALVRNPHAPQIYFILARLEVARKNNDEARNRLADALNEKSNYTEAIFLLSRIEADEGNVSQAIRIIETASVNLQNDPEVFFQLGLLRYSDNQFTGAISALERAVELDPSYLNARYFLGLSYDQVWENERAIEAFEAILLSSPGNEEIKLILDNLKNGLAPFTDSESSLDEDLEFIEEFSIEEQ
jgi:tetratricopeptide (TPR) repeat protein